MQCKLPYVTAKGEAFGCGQCLPCRINRRRIWSHRIMLEASCWGDNAVAHLTYNDELRPKELVKEDVQLWLKRLRKAIAPARLRFFLVGEYGDRSWHPHYHAVLFNYPTCSFGGTRNWRTYCCGNCELVRNSWGKGRIELRDLDYKAAQYVAGYVTKKMTGENDARLEGKAPEFARMSLRPGIGADGLWEVASEVLSYDLVRRLGDVPTTLRHSGKNIRPLGRYLVRRLRELSGEDPRAPKIVLARREAEMFDLLQSARLAAGKGYQSSQRFRLLLREALIEKEAGNITRLEGQFKLRQKVRPT